jgi:hypothetical protein
LFLNKDLKEKEMIGYSCSLCGSRLERRTIQEGNTSSVRFYCPNCNLSYHQESLCDVCHRAFHDEEMKEVVYISSILGTQIVRHCPNCQPPSQLSLELQTEPTVTVIKYGLIYGCPAFCFLMFIIAILLGASQR